MKIKGSTNLPYKLETEYYNACVILNLSLRRPDGVYVHFDHIVQILSEGENKETGLEKAITKAEDYFGITINRELLEVA